MLECSNGHPITNKPVLMPDGKEVPSKEIGEGIMEALKELDEVAYIRFASVYRQFKDLETFKKEVQKLMK